MKTVRKLTLATLALAAALLRADPNEAHHEVPIVAIVNFVTYPILDDSVAGIKAGLAEAGYEAPAVKVVEINANGEMDKLPAITREVLAMKPTVIIPVSTPVSRTVIALAPTTQPIVYSTVTNPSDVGMDSRPVNVTGVSDVVDFTRNFSLIQELFPKFRIIGMPYSPSEPNAEFGLREMQRLAKDHGVAIKAIAVSNEAEALDAVRVMMGTVDIVYIGSDNAVAAAVPGIVKIAHSRGVPVIASDAGSVHEGALAAVSVNYVALGERAGALAAETIRTGKLPGNIAPVKFLGETLVLNESAARQLKLNLPGDLRKRADIIVP